MTNVKLLLTPEETGRLLGVTPSTLESWRSTKRYALPYIKIGRKVRYCFADVEEFIATQKVSGRKRAAVVA